LLFTRLDGFSRLDRTRMTPQRGICNPVCGQESGPALCEPAPDLSEMEELRQKEIKVEGNQVRELREPSDTGESSHNGEPQNGEPRQNCRPTKLQVASRRGGTLMLHSQRPQSGQKSRTTGDQRTAMVRVRQS
jgi:hypothetical protein